MTSVDKGSRKECLNLISGKRSDVAGRLQRIAKGSGAVVTADDKWMPFNLNSACARREARLGSASNLLKPDQCDALTCWWLVNGGNTPNWDIANTCMIARMRGLLLVEAKAYEGELSRAGKTLRQDASQEVKDNHARIAEASGEANEGLNKREPTTNFNLSHDRCYPLSNRFAFAWKLATLGVPVAGVPWIPGFTRAEARPHCDSGPHSARSIGHKVPAHIMHVMHAVSAA